jgi:mono/diheme cytochrome c family protein
MIARRLVHALLLGLVATTAAAAEPSFDDIIQPFLKQHCFDCHGADEQQFQLRFDKLTSVQSRDRHLWTLIHEQIASGAMPPTDQLRPSDKDKRQVLAAIEEAQISLGRTATRRLCR